MKYLVSGCDIDFGFNVPVGESDSRLYPGHPEFSFVPADGKAHFGSSVPVTAFGLMNIEGYGYERFRYIGRYGEYRETDVKLAELDEHDVEGGSLITLTNNNIEVDGVAGRTLLRFCMILLMLQTIPLLHSKCLHLRMRTVISATA